jgi:putative ABC transport system permease protein
VEIVSDVAFALRIFARRPTIPLLVASLFALGVGFASGMWAVVDAAILRPLPFRDADTLVAVMEVHPERGLMAVTPANFLDWADRVTSLQVAAGEYAIDASITGTGLPERAAGAKVTERFFDLWGVPPAVGRVLQRGDFADAHRVVVLGHSLWARQFHNDISVIGVPIHIDGEPYTVVGVMPEGFRTVGNAEVWIPWVMSADEQRERRFHLVGTIARLRYGRAAAEAETELGTIYAQLQTAYPDTTAHWSARVLPVRDLLLGDSARALLVLGGAVLVLVVVAWINVASLLLVWLPSRRQEFLVRMALGATTSQVVRQLLLETSLWASAGMLAGLAIATSFVQLFGAVGVSTAVPFDFDPKVDARVIVTTAALLIVSVGATAVGPCVLAVHRSKDLVPRRAWATGGFGRQVTVAMQVALSIVLLSAASGLLVGFQHLSALTTPAVAVGSTLAMEVSRSETRQADDSDNRLFFERLLTALSERREIRAAAAASYIPPTRPQGNVRFSIEGRATSSDAQTALASAVSASAFRLLGIPLVRGRLIDDRDVHNAPYVAVMSETLSRRYWPTEDSIGRQITLVGMDTPITVVGVVADVRQPLSQDSRAEAVLYLSYHQVPWSFMTLMVAPAAEPSAAVAAVRQQVARLDASQATGSIQVLDALRTEWLNQPRLQTTVVTLFGLATLLLTVVGLYARMAHGVTARAREFAIRQAVGARPTGVVRQLTGEALVVVAIGIFAGLALLPFSTRALRGLVIDAPSLDLRLAVSMACVLALSGFVSAYWPARRAGRVDPAQLLKAE